MIKRYFTKIAVALIITAMLFTLFTFTVSAASADVNDVTAYRGETVTFTVTLSESVTIGSAAVEVLFDEAVLEYANGDASGVWNAPDALLSAFFSSAGNGALAYMEAASVSGDIFTVTLKVKDDAPVGTTEVKLNITLKDDKNATVELINNSGTVTVMSSSAAEPVTEDVSCGTEAPATALPIVIPVACGGVLVAVIIVVFVTKKIRR